MAHPKWSSQQAGGLVKPTRSFLLFILFERHTIYSGRVVGTFEPNPFRLTTEDLRDVVGLDVVHGTTALFWGFPVLFVFFLGVFLSYHV